MTLLGIDVGGTKVAAVAMREDGTVLHEYWREHHIRGADALLDEVATAATTLREQLRESGDAMPERIGLGIASWLTPDASTIAWAAHFRIRDFPIRAAAEARLGVPVDVDNDGNAQGLGEHRFGAGRGAHSLLLVSLGTGVGGALIVDGRPLRGAHGFAGELGHVTVLEDGPLCSCEAHGCLEAYAGGQALARVGARIAAARERAAGGVVTAKHLIDAALAGDGAAQGAVGDVGIAIAAALRRMLPAFDPETVVLGGSIGMAAHSLILPLVEQELAALAPLQSVPQPRRIVPAALGRWSTAIGSASLTLR